MAQDQRSIEILTAISRAKKGLPLTPKEMDILIGIEFRKTGQVPTNFEFSGADLEVSKQIAELRNQLADLGPVLSADEVNKLKGTPEGDAASKQNRDVAALNKQINALQKNLRSVRGESDVALADTEAFVSLQRPEPIKTEDLITEQNEVSERLKELRTAAPGEPELTNFRLLGKFDPTGKIADTAEAKEIRELMRRSETLREKLQEPETQPDTLGQSEAELAQGAATGPRRTLSSAEEIAFQAEVSALPKVQDTVLATTRGTLGDTLPLPADFEMRKNLFDKGVQDLKLQFGERIPREEIAKLEARIEKDVSADITRPDMLQPSEVELRNIAPRLKVDPEPVRRAKILSQAPPSLQAPPPLQFDVAPQGVPVDTTRQKPVLTDDIDVTGVAGVTDTGPAILESGEPAPGAKPVTPTGDEVAPPGPRPDVTEVEPPVPAGPRATGGLPAGPRPAASAPISSSIPRETGGLPAGPRPAVSATISPAVPRVTGSDEVPVLGATPEFDVPLRPELPVIETPTVGEVAQIKPIPGIEPGEFETPTVGEVDPLARTERPELPLFETPGQQDIPTLADPEFDTAAISRRAQEIAAPDIRRLRNAVQAAIAQGDRNPNVRRMTLRSALEGFGIGLGDVLAKARTKANEEITQQAQIKSEQAKTVFAAKTTQIRDKFAAEINTGQFNAEATINSLNQELANTIRANELEYTTEVQLIRDQFSAELAAEGAEFEAGESAKSLEYQGKLRVAEANLNAKNQAISAQFKADVQVARDMFTAATRAQEQDIQSQITGEAATFNAQFEATLAIFDRAYDKFIISGQQEFQAAEAAIGREFVTGERVGAQEFSATERALDRALTTDDREAIQAFQTSERVRAQEFRAGERISSQDWTSIETELGRTFSAEEREAIQAFQTSERVSGQEFRAEESEKDRKARIDEIIESGDQRLIRDEISSLDDQLLILRAKTLTGAAKANNNQQIILLQNEIERLRESLKSEE